MISSKVCTSHYWRLWLKNDTLLPSRARIFWGFRPSERGSNESLRKEAKKKFALLEQTLNKHEDIKREREYKIYFKIVRLKILNVFSVLVFLVL